MKRNYGPTTAPGQTRTRICKIEGINENQMTNPDAVPYINYTEETAIRLDKPQSPGAIEVSLGQVASFQQFYSPQKIITIRNPLTDEAGAVGRIPPSLTMAETYAVIYSLGRQAQTDRDAAEEG